MLAITEDDAHNCLLVEPSGRLRSEDFEELAGRFDARADASGRVTNLVIHARDFPGWADFGALLSHLQFVREHQKLVDKVALVSDARILDLAPRIARHFVVARIRHFPESDLQNALTWVAEPEGSATHVTVLEGLPDDVVAISVHGVVTARDYTEVIVPLIQERLRHHRKLKFLYRIGPEFRAFTPGAAWSDARVGIMHLTQFSKIAVVTDLDWVRHATRVFAPLIPGQVHVFSDDQLQEAERWVAGPAEEEG